jgi:hypothetical protein
MYVEVPCQAEAGEVGEASVLIRTIFGNIRFPVRSDELTGPPDRPYLLCPARHVSGPVVEAFVSVAGRSRPHPVWLNTAALQAA